MAKIKIGSVIINDASLTDSNDLLGIRYETDMSLEELATMYDANVAPEIFILNDDDSISTIYMNRSLSNISLSVVEDKRIVSVVLKVANAELSETQKLNEKIIKQEAEITKLKDLISNTQSRLTVTETKIPETETRLTEAEAKIPETEARIAQTETRLAETAAKIPETEAKLLEAENHVQELKTKNEALTTQVQELSDRNALLEDCIAEMAAVIYA